MNKYFLFLIPFCLFLNSCFTDFQEHQVPVKKYSIYCDSLDFNSIHQDFKSNRYINVSLSSGAEKTNVKLRMRGDSSREYPKKSLKVKTLKDGLVDGKRIFNFNAEYKDQSFSHSYISSLIFKELNYPCFTSSMASLYVNDNFHGLFLEIENMDKDFLVRNKLNPKGDLYKATKDGACLYALSELDVKWEKKSNKKNSWAPLRNLISDLEGLDQPDFETYIKANFDYAKLIDYLAINNFIANGSTNYHNYYLYKDVENNGKWMFIPWDMDKTLSYYNWKPFAYHFTSSDWENDNPIIERCYLSESIKADVIQRLLSFEDILGADFYEPILTSIETTLQSLVLADKTDKVNTEKQWQKAIHTERRFLQNRVQKALAKMEEFPLSFEVYKTASLLSIPFYLSWDKAADSTEVSYEVYISKDFLYTDSTSTKVYKTQDGVLKITDNLPLGTYFWKVVAVKKGLKVDGFNSRNSFELREGTLLPSFIDASLTLTEQGSPYLISDSLIIAKDVVLNAEEGTLILASKNAEIKVFGGLKFEGEADNKIEIRPNIPNSYFHSIYFYLSNYENSLEHVSIYEGLINSRNSTYSLNNVSIAIKNRPMQFGSKRPSIIWAWHGDISIDSLSLYGNGKGEGININWADVKVLNSRFYNTPDAIEFINVTGGEISNNLVLNSPDDAIDLNACKDVLIQNNTLVNSADKGISIGAEQYGKSSNITVKYNYILGNKIALSVKDSADVYCQNNTYAYNSIAFQAYIKNKTYELGGIINSINDAFYGNETLKQIDEFSSSSKIYSTENLKVFKQGSGFFIPQKLTYSIVDGLIILTNNSHLDFSFHEVDLMINNKVSIPLNKCDHLSPGEYLVILKQKPKERKYSNYLIHKSYTVEDYTAISLKFNGVVFPLKEKVDVSVKLHFPYVISSGTNNSIVDTYFVSAEAAEQFIETEILRDFTSVEVYAEKDSVYRLVLLEPKVDTGNFEFFVRRGVPFYVFQNSELLFKNTGSNFYPSLQTLADTYIFYPDKKKTLYQISLPTSDTIKVLFKQSVKQGLHKVFEVVNIKSLLVDQPKTQNSPWIEISSQSMISDTGYTEINLHDTDSVLAVAKIKIRGSSSKVFPKKQFSLKSLNSRSSTKAIKSVLYAPYIDRSLIRNKLAYDLFSSLSGDSINSYFTHLIVNGSYEGIYLMQNHPKALFKNNVKYDNPNSFLVQIDRCPCPIIHNSKVDSFINPAYVFEVPSKPTDIQKFAIDSKLIDFENALYNNDLSAIDVKSFVDLIILNELSKNIDAYRLSTYLAFDGTQISIPTVWDFNIAWGLAEHATGFDATGFIINGENKNYAPYWWQSLWNNKEFQIHLKESYSVYRQEILSPLMLNKSIDSLVADLGTDKDLNFEKWPLFGTNIWPNKYKTTSHEEEISRLKGWIKLRMDWLDSKWLD
ncbi:MAG: CotH kinase family protein [Flavobacteriales bacterium]